MVVGACRERWDRTVTMALPILNGLAAFGGQRGLDFTDLHPYRSADDNPPDEEERKALAFVHQLQRLRALPERERLNALEQLRKRDGTGKANQSGVGIHRGQPPQ